MRIANAVMVVALPCSLALGLSSQAFPLARASAVVYAAGHEWDDDNDRFLNRSLVAVLSAAGFTGEMERTFNKTITENLGRPINPKLANLGRLLWFDKLQSLGRDNSCGGCHSPTNGMGDSQPMSIGVQNNNIVGPHRTGPRNQRRAPTVVNAALYPTVMWNSRFASVARDPFDGSLGFSLPAFPVPEDLGAPNAPIRFSGAQNALHGVTHLLQAHAHMPSTQLAEAAGFAGTCPNGVPDTALGPRFCQFDAGDPGLAVPPPDAGGFRDEPIREATLAALNGSAAYRRLFREVFPETAPPQNDPIDFFMVAKAIAEFEFTLVFADAPLDRFARGDVNAMSPSQKRGGLIFFGKAKCTECHKIDGHSNEMFSDFEEHVIGVPQIAPAFGAGQGNVLFSGPGENEDFGREEHTGDRADRYKFRTAPLRNLAVAPAFFHNGAYTRLDEAIRFHLNVTESARNYNPVAAGVPDDLAHRAGPPVPKTLLDPRMRNRVKLTEEEIRDLVHFVENGLTDQRVKKSNLCDLIPSAVPSGLAPMVFEGCPRRAGASESIRSGASPAVP